MDSPKQLDRLMSLVFSTMKLIKKKTWRQDLLGPISFSQLKTLYYVAEHPTCPMGDITSELGISPSSTTATVDQLVQAGFMARVEAPGDRRTVRLEVTEEGRAVLTKGVASVKAHMSGIFAHLDVEDQDHLIRILEKLTKVYEA